MNPRRIFLALLIALAFAFQGIPTQARQLRSIKDDLRSGVGDGLPTQQSESPTGFDPVVGSWDATFYSSASPAQFKPLPALFTFNQDETLTETDGGELAPFEDSPGHTVYSSPGHGAWDKVGDNLYDLVFHIIAVNPDGTFNSKGVVTLRIRVDASGNSFRGFGHFAFFFPNGSPIPGASGDEKIAGKRIML
jgi:hypothetical protein